jgi:aminoglycoside phosphotransferase (APT) family kinase protein
VPEWDADIALTPALALELVREQFPGLGRTIEPLGSGWDNVAYLVDGELVFRFPRRKLAVPFIGREARLLPKLAPRLPLPIPVPLWVGTPTERFPRPFAGYRRIAGRTFDAAELSGEDLRAAAQALAVFLKALHAIPLDDLELPPDERARTDFTQRLPVMAERMEALERAGRITDHRRWIDLFGDGICEPPPALVPVHGDLYERQVLVDDANRVCGVIDWGDTHAGDSALDLTVLYRFFPAAARDDFLRIYGPIDARTAHVARLRAAQHASVGAFFAHATHDALLLRASLAGLRNVLED